MAGSLLPGADSAPPELRFHGFNQYLQLFLALFWGVAVDVSGALLAVRPSGGIPSFPEVVTDLMDAAGAGLAPLPRVCPESGHGWMLCLLGFLRRHLLLPNPLVDFGRCLPLHGFRHVGVDVQGGAGEPVPHHRREGLHVHAVLQRRGHEGVPEIMEPDLGALGPFQNPAQQLPDCRRI